ncbi:MAG: S-methyl-5'-thioinosine phosphorylase [Acidimicrobiales bacterium]|jgi:5'-deoxy-5'-methylthioadenosine phosphorylase|nr:S-methyl-5'-thioinosine phosphorylase [Acidimicrobiales bacterium]
MIGIIAGSGYYELPGLLQRNDETINTEYGEATVSTGIWDNVAVAFVARHGGDHSIPPNAINYRANIRALADLGVRSVFAVNVVGSLVLERGPGSLFILDDFIEFTQGRQCTFFDRPGEVTHTDMTSIYDRDLRQILIRSAEAEEQEVTESATYVCVNGPRFETPAEIRMFAQLGAQVVGMTGYPEVALAREAGLRYASVAVVSNLAAGMTNDVIEEKEIWEALEATKDPVFRILKRSVQLCAADEC